MTLSWIDSIKKIFYFFFKLELISIIINRGGVAGVSPAGEGGEQRSASQGETSPLLSYKVEDKNYGI
jgi:hypothetical protein